MEIKYIDPIKYEKVDLPIINDKIYEKIIDKEIYLIIIIKSKL